MFFVYDRQAWEQVDSQRRSSGSLSDQLSYVYDLLSLHANTAQGKDILGGILRDLPCILVEQGVGDIDGAQAAGSLASRKTVQHIFIQASQLYGSIDEDIPPYAWSLSRAHRDVRLSSNLIEALKIERIPRYHTVHQWSADLAAQAGGHPLSADQLSTAVKIANVAAKILTTLPQPSAHMIHGAAASPAADGTDATGSDHNRPALAGIYLPDKNGVLRLSTRDLFFDDAPWLDTRIDRSRVPLIHQKVSGSTALALGVRALSSAVREVVERREVELVGGRGSDTSHDVSRAVAKWNENISAPAFQGAIRRAARHRQANSGFENDSKRADRSRGNHGGASIGLTEAQVALRISLLSRARLVLASRLPSSFLLSAGQEGEVDVTARRDGSQAVLVLEDEYGNTVSSPRQRGGDAVAAAAMGGTPVVYLLLEKDENGQTRAGWRRRW